MQSTDNIYQWFSLHSSTWYIVCETLSCQDGVLMSVCVWMWYIVMITTFQLNNNTWPKPQSCWIQNWFSWNCCITLTLNDWVHIFIHKCICQDIDTNICCITVTSLIIDPIRCGLTLWWQSMPIWKITLLLFVFCCVHYKVKRPEYSLRKVLSWAKIFLKLPGRPLVLGRYREDLCGAS